MCLRPRYIGIIPQRRHISKKSGNITRWDPSVIEKVTYYRANGNNTRKQKVYKVGCGQCPECRAAKADQWGVRGYLQTITEPNGIFITLTYNTENLPDGKELCKRDTQLFKKRLRELKEEYYQKKAESFIKTRQSKENKQKDNKQGK